MNSKVLAFTAIGFECVGAVAAGVLIGRHFDEKYGWNGLATAAGATFAIVGWFVHLFVMLRQLSKDDDAGTSGEG